MRRQMPAIVAGALMMPALMLAPAPALALARRP
jgi:hypothetical protein